MNGIDYLPRLADRVLTEMLEDHAAVLVSGPRATGKTTTAARQARSTFRLGVDREAAAVRADPVAALRGSDEPILIDEWQIVPGVLSAVKVLVDTEPRRGRFVVTGSVRGDIDSPVWPGTGRLVRLSMFGLVEREIEGKLTGPTWLDQVLTGTVPTVSSRLDLRSYVERALRGGFPESAIAMSVSARARWLASYADQLVTRDAPDVDAGRDPQRLRRYLEALALNSAGTVDDTTLYGAAQISKDTARAYDRLLQNLLVIDKVPAWTSNRLKRLTLAPKRFLVDSGLLGATLRLTSDGVHRDGDLLGRLIETFVVAQLRAELALLPTSPRLHHLRTAEGRHEIDVVIEVGPRQVVAIEIKATSSPSADDARHLRWLRSELGDDAVVASIVLHSGPRTFPLDERTVACPIASLWS